MVDIFKLPIYDPRTPEEKERDDILRTAQLVRDGAAARRLGHDYTTCPPFRIQSWMDDWIRGWRDEDKKIIAERLKEWPRPKGWKP